MRARNVKSFHIVHWDTFVILASPPVWLSPIMGWAAKSRQNPGYEVGYEVGYEGTQDFVPIRQSVFHSRRKAMKISDGYPLAGRCDLRQEGEKGLSRTSKSPVYSRVFRTSPPPRKETCIAAASAYFTLVLAGRIFQENVNTVVLESDADLPSKY